MAGRERVYIGRGSYEQSPFVGRGEEIERFGEVMERIGRQGPVTSNLFEWHGVPGVGKSALMQELDRVARDKYRARVSLVDFGKLDTPELMKDPVKLLERMGKELKGCIDGKSQFINMQGFENAVKIYQKEQLPSQGVVASYAVMDQETRLYKRPSWLDEQRNVVIAFLKAVNSGSPTVPKVMLFDHMDRTPVELIDWVEEWVVNPLIQVRSVFVGANFRRPWRWKRPEIRRRLTSTELEGLSRPEATEMMNRTWTKPETLVPAVIEEIYQLTQGHPAAMRAVKK